MGSTSTPKPARLVTRIRRWTASRTPWLHRAVRPGWRALNQFLRVDGYWPARRHLRYYREAVRLAHQHVPNGGSVLDVGSATTEVLVAMDWFSHRVALDLHRPLRRQGIEPVVMDFMDYAPRAPFDLVLCLQVLEHVADPAAFLSKLFATGCTVIISVPYKWPPGKAAGHRHDPIDETTLARWTGQSPIETLLISEGSDRLIAVYRAIPQS